MVGDENQKKPPTEQLTARVRPGLIERMRKLALARNIDIGKVWSCAAETFLDLPEGTQIQILTGEIKQSVTLIEIVHQIVDDHIAAGERAGRALSERRKRKPGQGD